MQGCLKTWCEILLKHIITADWVFCGPFIYANFVPPDQYDQYQESWSTPVNDHPSLTIVCQDGSGQTTHSVTALGLSRKKEGRIVIPLESNRGQVYYALNYYYSIQDVVKVNCTL